MKHFLKIKRVMVFDNGEYSGERIVIRLHCGYDVVKSGTDYINVQTGEVYEPLFDEFTEELIGFIG